MNKIIKHGKKVITIERKAISEIEKRFLDENFRHNFIEAVETIYKCKGKIIVTGIGKSGIIAQKIVATFNSTGTYSMFLHSAESIHGDLGVVKEGDIVMIVSKSGNTSEIKKLIPVFKKLKIKIIVITGNTQSQLSKLSDIVLDSSVKEEACPFNLAPTSSSTAALVLGDSLAIALMHKRGFSKEQYAEYHPGGSLGDKLLLKVEDIMIKENDIPVVSKNTYFKDIIYMISSKRLGCTVIAEKNSVLGIITDGDLRRLLEKNIDVNKLKAKDIMKKNPKVISPNTLAKTALEIMERNKITQLVICSAKKKLEGIIHMHSLVEKGL